VIAGMGLEARCTVTWKGSSRTADVHLDSAALEVRGRPRLVLPFGDIRRIVAAADELTLETVNGTLSLALGEAVERWARKIAAPPSRCKKLGIAPGQRVSVIGLDDVAFDAELRGVGAERVGVRSKADFVILHAEDPGDLSRLVSLRTRIEPDGGIWVVRTKGKDASVKEAMVRTAARAAGLVDVKVAAFSPTLTADKLVIPVAERDRVTAPRPGRAAPPRAKPNRAGRTAEKSKAAPSVTKATRRLTST
jgi:hypothetical protein